MAIVTSSGKARAGSGCLLCCYHTNTEVITVVVGKGWEWECHIVLITLEKAGTRGVIIIETWDWGATIVIIHQEAGGDGTIIGTRDRNSHCHKRITVIIIDTKEECCCCDCWGAAGDNNAGAEIDIIVVSLKLKVK